RIRNYHDEETHWRVPEIRRRVEATILKPTGLCVDVFGRPRLERVLTDWFDRRLGPAQVVGALFTYEKYFEGLPGHLQQAARLCETEATSRVTAESLVDAA